jgi:ornithine cyclodeaminase/alanine dehydrogenase
MTVTHSPLYLTDADICGLDIDAGSVRAAMQDAFALYAGGKLRCAPKASIWLGEGHAFQTLSAADTQNNFAAVKWVGMVPPGGAAGVNINASILLSDALTGQLRCLMDARRATALRTAGMSAVAAQYLARRDSASIGFVGAGVQAESHLLALSELLPSLRTVHVHSVPAATAQRLCDRARALGFEASTVSAQEAVSQSDIVVTTVPLVPGLAPFIEASWLRPGALAIAVDLGRSWKHEGLAEMDATFVDEEAMKHAAKPGNLVPVLEHAQATLADLAGGRHPGRSHAQHRILLVTSGSAVADLAIARLIYARALAKGAGTPLSP